MANGWFGVGNRREPDRVNGCSSITTAAATWRSGWTGCDQIAMGDGGERRDDQGVGHSPGPNAQNLSVPRRQILRIYLNGRDSANGQSGDNSFAIPGSSPLSVPEGDLSFPHSRSFRTSLQGSGTTVHR